ncbi:MAG: hypothetical protein AAFN17_00950 [Pseudomonadota bacterium]
MSGSIGKPNAPLTLIGRGPDVSFQKSTSSISSVSTGAFQGAAPEPAPPKPEQKNLTPSDPAKPRFMAHGPAFKTPIKQFSKEALDGLQKAVREAAKANNLPLRTLKIAIKDAQYNRDHAITDFAKFQAEEKMKALAVVNDPIKERGEALRVLAEAVTEVKDGLKALHAERVKPIPTDAKERNAFFDKLIELEKTLSSSTDKMMVAFFAIEKASEDIEGVKVEAERLGLNTKNMAGIKKFGDTYKAVAQALLEATVVDPRAKTVQPAEIRGQMGDAIGRASQLKEQLNTVEATAGSEALKNLLGNGRLTAEVALQAIRAGETLSPALLETITDKNAIHDVRELGNGQFNKVLLATLDEKDGSQKRYALKPLDSRIQSPGWGYDIGHSHQQVGVFGRQSAAHTLSEELGLKLAGAPRYVVYENRLYMAAPLIPGDDGEAIETKIEDAVTAHNDKTTDASQKMDAAAEQERIFEALHTNPRFQNACQEMQLFQCIISNPDGHSNNMKMEFRSAGKLVDPGDLVGMSDKDIAELEVKAAVFDLDGAFLADPTISIQQFRHHKGDYFAPRWHYAGPPPFHTQAQYDRLVELRRKLDDQLVKQLSGYLTNGTDNVHPVTNETEMSALRSRVEKLIDHFDKQASEGRRLDEKGYVLNGKGQRTGEPNQQQRLSDSSEETRNFGMEPGKMMKQSVAHKFFPVPEPVKKPVKIDNTDEEIFKVDEEDPKHYVDEDIYAEFDDEFKVTSMSSIV